jgi:hypothetical protein
MNPLITTSLLLTILSFTACGTPGTLQAYTRVDRPLFAVIRELNEHPNNFQAREYLLIVYAQTVAKHEKAIQIHSSRESFHKVLYELEALQHIYYAIQSVPAARRTVSPRDYSRMIADIENAAYYYESISDLYTDLGEEEGDDQ